jgi:hypothetical protein
MSATIKNLSRERENLPPYIDGAHGDSSRRPCDDVHPQSAGRHAADFLAVQRDTAGKERSGKPQQPAQGLGAAGAEQAARATEQPTRAA